MGRNIGLQLMQFEPCALTTRAANIRFAAPADASAIMELARCLVTPFRVEAASFQDSFEETLCDPHSWLLVADIRSDVVGYLLGSENHSLYANGRAAWVQEIVVSEAYRRNGVGKCLMHAFEKVARGKQCKFVALATGRSALFYESMGYEHTASYFRKLL